MTPALLERLLAGRRAGKPLALATAIPGGAQALIDAETAEGELILAPEDLAAIRAAIADDVSRTTKTGLGPVFVEVWNPPLRLILIGAVHIGQTLAPMAALGGYKVTVIDPRAGFARAERLPGVEIIADWPDEVLPGLAPDKRTAIVTLTHDPKIDDPALAAALRSDAFYIGALGSRRTHAKRAERLAAEGFTAAQIARIRGPVGLAIGALTPAEIAISILAEITAVLHRAGLAARPGEAA
jgi:xanthine dehydrogenase accessory factor